MSEEKTDVVTDEVITGTPASESTEKVSEETITDEKKPEGESTKPEDKNPDPPKENKENHDVRRMRKFMERAFKAEAELKAFQTMQAQQAAAAQETGEPKRDQFQDDLSYLEARQDYRLKKIQETIKPVERHDTGNWYDREEKAREVYPDYDEVIEDAVDVMIPPVAVEAINSSELGPDLKYYLAKNPKEAEKLMRTEKPVDQARIIGQIEAKIEAKKNLKPVKTSAAPKPIAPVKTTSGEVNVDPDQMSEKDYWAWRKRQLTKK
jgi:hypothetical protein